MKLPERGLCFIPLFVCFMLFYLAISPINAQTTQPPSNTPTTNPVTTNVPTTTTDVPTTTTQVQTTTTLPPTPEGPRTVIGNTDIGQCLCDLTGNECDVLCCCDDECTAEDKTAFNCSPEPVVLDNRKCFQENIFPFSAPNSPAETEHIEGGLFCIYFDNYKERNFYLDPDFILDFPSFQEYLDEYAKASLQRPDHTMPPTYTLNSFYKQGDPVYIVYQNLAVGYLNQPTSTASNLCVDQNPISYLTESVSECSRDVILNAATCNTTHAFRADSYYSNFKIVQTPALFGYIVNGTFVDITTPVPPTTAPVTTAAPTGTTDNSTATNTTATTTTTTTTTTTAPPTTVDVSQIQDIFNNPYTFDVDTTSLTHLCKQPDGSLIVCPLQAAPSYVNGVCTNLVLEVRYVLTTNGTSGLSSVAVQFVYGDISAAQVPVTQKYTVTYDTLTDSNDTMARSGNPGYVIGKPLLYGTYNDTLQQIETISEGLTLVRPTATGDCVTSLTDRVPVKFGENMRTGCVIRLNTQNLGANCENIQNQIFRVLEGSSERIDHYVATFGNVRPNKLGDWVRVIPDRPSPSNVQPANGCKLRMGLHLQVIYANVGALANPQAKILGVAQMYDSLKDVNFKCVGASCQDGVSEEQIFEVSHTVSFVDVSQPAVKVQGEPPIFIARVPNDFFYPFLYYTGGSSRLNHEPVLAIVMVVVSLLYNLRGKLL